jgi:microcystin degradation protein MlrC
MCVHIGVARVFQKSNSFARNATSLEDFYSHEWLIGEQFFDRFRESDSIIRGVIDESCTRGATTVPLLSASAPAGGPLDPATLQTLSSDLATRILNSTTALDGLIIQASGTMTTTDGLSGDELLIQAVRDVFPSRPIVLIVSQHANLSPDVAHLVNYIVTPDPVPTGDCVATGRAAVDALIALKENGEAARPHIESLPLLIPVAAQRSDVEPLHSFFEQLQYYRRKLGSPSAISLLAGYPYADVAFAGASLVVNSGVVEGSRTAAELAEQLWNHRHRFFVEGSNVEEAVHYAMDTKETPVLIADLGDNPDDGAPGDGTTVLWALIDLGVRHATVGAIADEQAVDACVRAGVDSKVSIPVGGRKDTRHGYPIDISGRVTSIHEGAFKLSGPIYRGGIVDAGIIVVLDVEARHEGHVELVLTEKPVQITDRSFFDHIGIELAERTIVSIKSANEYRPGFESIAAKIFEVITPGITTPDPAFYAYQNVRRPIYPLDEFDSGN